jgi:branched-chain amino acid transport system substrate-binding protein
MIAATISAVGLTLAVAAHADTQSVLLGLAAPMTGAQAQYGKDFQSGVLLALDDFNATKPKVDGKETRFTLESMDDQADPKTGTVVAQKLVDDGIKGMIGHFNSIHVQVLRRSRRRPPLHTRGKASRRRFA